MLVFTFLATVKSYNLPVLTWLMSIFTKISFLQDQGIVKNLNLSSEQFSTLLKFLNFAKIHILQDRGGQKS